MAQDKEEKKTEDETYKAEAVHRLELAKADEKRIREEIEALKRKSRKPKKPRKVRLSTFNGRKRSWPTAACWKRLPDEKRNVWKNHQFRQPRRTA